MEAVSNTTALTSELKLKSGSVLQIIGDAALYVENLPPAKRGLFHWQVAEKAIFEAGRNSGNEQLLNHATEALKNALDTENNLDT